MRNFIQKGDTATVIAGQAYSSGDVVVLNDTIGIAVSDAAIGEELLLATEGVYSVPFNPAESASVGDAIYWDLNNSRCTKNKTSVFAGQARSVSLDGAVAVKLNATQVIDTASIQTYYVQPVKTVQNGNFASALSLGIVYDNGIDGVGAYIEEADASDGDINSIGAFFATLAVGDRVLILNESFENGVYVVDSIGDGDTIPFRLTRATDFNTATNLFANKTIPVLEFTPGSTFGVDGDSFFQSATGLTTVGTDVPVYDAQSTKSATRITVLPQGNLTSTNVQNGLVELQSDVDGRALKNGWGRYGDTQYTVGAPFILTQSATFSALPNNKANTLETLPPGASTFYDGTHIRPMNANDYYIFTIRFKAKSSSNQGSFDFGIDIGGTQGIIFGETLLFSKGMNTEQFFSIDTPGFTGSTFLANGGIIKIAPVVGDIEIYDISLQVAQIYRAQ